MMKLHLSLTMSLIAFLVLAMTAVAHDDNNPISHKCCKQGGHGNCVPNCPRQRALSPFAIAYVDVEEPEAGK